MEYSRIRQIREERDLKQKEIAKVLHISQRTYSGYETGIRNIPVQARSQTRGILRIKR